MVCCIAAAALLGVIGLILRPFRHARCVSPLACRPGGSATARPPVAAAGFTLSARLRSFGFAFAGLGFLFRHEHNMRIHAVAAGAAIMLGILLNISLEDWRWIVVAIVLVITAEAINTAIEQTCNAIGPHHSEAIRAAKDVAAGGVLLCTGAALFIGLTIFVPYLPMFAEPATLERFCGYRM